ncbi:MAG: hypothetical protein Hals2KO_26580 [Halioglobus sp.]
MQRPVWLFSMDSEAFLAPPTTTATLLAYFNRYGASAAHTDVELVHFQQDENIDAWLDDWRDTQLPLARAAQDAGQQPIAGFSFYTWNAAQFLQLATQLKSELPGLLIIAGGPHVQQAEDYLGVEDIDVVFLGEAEATLQEFLDCTDRDAWANINGLAYLANNEIHTTEPRPRCADLDTLPSPLEVLQLTNSDGEPLYESIAYETSRGCPFKCAFCEWGTGAIGSRMYQWSLDRVRSDWERITAAGIKDIWLADSNFGALKQDLAKARILVELKERTGLPVSFATSWSKKHSRQVQEIALLLHKHQLLPHYQLALQTLTPEALRLSNRQNMSSNEYKPIAKSMSEQGVPIAAELIWGLPGDTLAEFESNLDELLGDFPNINIFGYTLLPGTEFYRRREEYRIEAVPVAGYGKAKGEYVVGCHSFSRDEGEEGYSLITAHILLVHGHIMPLTTRLLALHGEVPVSRLFREILRNLLALPSARAVPCNFDDRLSIYEARDAIYLAVLSDRESLYQCIAATLEQHHATHDIDPTEALQVLQLDRALAPRSGGESRRVIPFSFNARETHSALSAMALPCITARHGEILEITHPGGLGDFMQVADGGSWIQGVITPEESAPSAIEYVAIA